MQFQIKCITRRAVWWFGGLVVQFSYDYIVKWWSGGLVVWTQNLVHKKYGVRDPKFSTQKHLAPDPSLVHKTIFFAIQSSVHKTNHLAIQSLAQKAN